MATGWDHHLQARDGLLIERRSTFTALCPRLQIWQSYQVGIGLYGYENVMSCDSSERICYRIPFVYYPVVLLT